jgi:glutathione S-transferase
LAQPGRTLEKIEAVANVIADAGGTATAVQADATSEARVVELFAKAESIGPVEVSIYNAGNNMPGKFPEHGPLSVVDYRTALDAIHGLSRIPCPVLEDGEVLVDSHQVLADLDRQVGPERALVPREPAAQRAHGQMIALSTGSLEKTVALVYEIARRPKDKDWMGRLPAGRAVGEPGDCQQRVAAVAVHCGEGLPLLRLHVERDARVADRTALADADEGIRVEVEDAVGVGDHLAHLLLPRRWANARTGDDAREPRHVPKRSRVGHAAAEETARLPGERFPGHREPR